MPERAQIDILGIRVDDVTYGEALSRMEAYITDGQPHQVVTVNPEFIMTARQDSGFAQVLNQAHLALPDGQGLLWAARTLGTPLRERVTGVDVVVRMAALAAQRGYRMYLLGAAEGVAPAAARVLRRRYPSLAIVGTFAGSPAVDHEESILATIRQAGPHVLLVAYGAPQQDKWIARNLHRSGVPVAMGVGGAFDFISGKAKRAPRWMRRLGLEWLHRFGREPWRWRRMLALPAFAWLVLRARVR